MESTNFTTSIASFVTVLCNVRGMGMGLVFAHCDTMDGPIIKSAQQALDTGKVDLVLMWIQKKDESELKQAFQKAREVRKINPAAKELADRYFLETFVRLHRAGEGAPFTGIKPAGSEIDPAVVRADKALETGSADDLMKFMSETVIHGVREHYDRTMALRKHAGHNVDAGREFAAAYVTYVHYVEKLYNMATAKEAHHGHEAPADKHEH